MKDRALLAIDRCREVIAGHMRQLAQRAEEDAQQQHARPPGNRPPSSRTGSQRHMSGGLAAAEARASRGEEKARAEKLRGGARVAPGRRLIGKANSALREGNTARAAGLRRAVEEKLPTVPACRRFLASSGAAARYEAA